MKAKDLTLIALMSASLTAGKLVLASIPNVEIVTFLIIIYSITFGIRRSLLMVVVFVTTEILIFGFGTWLLGYYVMWPSLVLLAVFMDKWAKSEYHWAALSGFYGLTFGIFFAVTESLFYGAAYGLAYWIRGIPFDLIHGVSNFIIMLTLFKPVRARIEKIKSLA